MGALKKDRIMLLYVVYPQKYSLKKHVNQMLKEKLIVCANIIPGMESCYLWKGKVESSKEFIVLYKTLKSSEKKLKAYIEKNHPYDVPFIASLGAIDVNESYLKFASAQLKN